MESHPEINAARAQVSASHSALCLARADRIPIPSVGPVYERDETGTPRPSYRCLFPESPPPGTVAPCSEAGILGAVAGVLGTLQAVEVVKEILQLGESLVGRLLLYDALATRFTTVTYAYDPGNPLHGREPGFPDLSHHRKAMADASG